MNSCCVYCTCSFICHASRCCDSRQTCRHILCVDSWQLENLNWTLNASTLQGWKIKILNYLKETHYDFSASLSLSLHQVVSQPRLSVCRTRRLRSTPACVIPTPGLHWAPISAIRSLALHSKCVWVKEFLCVQLAVGYVACVFMLPNFQEPRALFFFCFF